MCVVLIFVIDFHSIVVREYAVYDFNPPKFSENFKQQGYFFLAHFPVLLLRYRWHRALDDDVATRWGKPQT